MICLSCASNNINPKDQSGGLYALVSCNSFFACLFLPALNSWDAAWQQEDEQKGAMLVALGLGSVGDGNANSEIGNTQKTLASPERR
jgi:hypothetical protein